MTTPSAPQRATQQIFSALALLLLATGSALAQTATQVQPPTAWRPTRPVTIVVPYAPGGGTDTTARAVAKQLTTLWGQPVLVENQPGADGLIGTRRVSEAKPDGYTLVLQTPAIVLTRYTPGLKGVDPLAQLDPITMVAQSPGAFVASAKLPVKTLSELFQYCKTSATPCSMATGENVARLVGRQIAAEGLSDLIVVNYKGTAAIVTDLIANNVNFAFTGITAAMPHHKAGTLRILSTQGSARALALPEVPSTVEAGFAQYQFVTWYGLFAPKGTPAAIAQSFVAALRESLKDPDVQKTIAAAGAEPVVNGSVEFEAQVRAEAEHFGRLTKRFPLD